MQKDEPVTKAGKAESAATAEKIGPAATDEKAEPAIKGNCVTKTEKTMNSSANKTDRTADDGVLESLILEKRSATLTIVMYRIARLEGIPRNDESKIAQRAFRSASDWQQAINTAGEDKTKEASDQASASGETSEPQEDDYVVL